MYSLQLDDFTALHFLVNTDHGNQFLSQIVLPRKEEALRLPTDGTTVLDQLTTILADTVPAGAHVRVTCRP